MIKSLPKKHLALLVGDITLIIGSFYLSPVLRFGVCPLPTAFLEWTDLSAILIYLLLFYIFDFYNLNERFNTPSYFFRFLLTVAFADIIIASLFYIFNVRPYATLMLMINTILILLLCLGWRMLFFQWIRGIQQVLRVLIIGAGWAGTDLTKLLAERKDFQVVGFLDDDQNKWGKKEEQFGASVIGGTDLLSSIIKDKNIDLVIIAITNSMNQDLYKRIIEAKVKGLSVYEMATFCEIVLGKIPVQHVSNLWFVYVPISGVRKTTYNQKVKKIMDIFFSLIIIIVLFPAILIVALAIKLDSPGPVFFVQRRIGWRGQPFNLVKYRTMRVGTENHRNHAGQKNDPRITRVGKILRRSRFDEIPQVWNVIRGEMSFIGPRALMEEEVNEFTPRIPYFSLRHSIKPGITGWAQINYPHGTTIEDGLRKLEYDLYYLKNLSPWLDILILVRTIRTVLFGWGAR